MFNKLQREWKEPALIFNTKPLDAMQQETQACHWSHLARF